MDGRVQTSDSRVNGNCNSIELPLEMNNLPLERCKPLKAGKMETIGNP